MTLKNFLYSVKYIDNFTCPSQVELLSYLCITSTSFIHVPVTHYAENTHERYQKVAF